MIVDNQIIDGVLIGRFPDGILIDLETAKTMVKERLEFQNGKSYPILIYSNGFKIDSHDAREFMKKEGLEGMKAGAFMVKNSFEKMVANFFIKIKPPGIPAKFFTDEQEAMLWLKQFRD